MHSLGRGAVVTLVLALTAGGVALADELATKLKQRVEEVVAGSRPLAETKLEVVFAKPEHHSLTVFGSGVGLWNREKQFALGPAEHKELFKLLLSKGYFEMPESPKPSWDKGRVPNGPRIMRAVTVTVGDLERTVFQTDRVPTLQELDSLASNLFELCAIPASKGVGATSLADGLAKVVSGALAPETLTASFNLPPVEAKANAPGEPGVVALLAGGVMTWRPQEPGQVPADPVKIEIPAARIRELAQLLVKQGVATFPINLFRDRYVDLRVGVLDRLVSVQARRFAGMDPKKNAAAQQSLEIVLDSIRALGPPSHGQPQTPRGPQG